MGIACVFYGIRQGRVEATTAKRPNCGGQHVTVRSKRGARHMTSPVAPPRPARDGVPKWLIILLVVVLFVVLGSMSYWVSKRVEAPEIQQAAQEQIEGQGAAVDNDDTGLSVPTE